MHLSETIDTWIARVLFVTPQPVTEEEFDSLNQSAPAERAFGLSLLISGIRCILQYVILPIALPLIGFTSNFSLAIVLLLDLVALGLLISSLRFFWRTNHPRRFDMLPLSFCILLLILGTISFDIWSLVAGKG